MRHFQSVKLLRAGAFCVPALLFSVGAQLRAQNVQMAGGESGTKAHVVESYGKLPLSFEANRGQTDTQVKFLARGAGYGLFLTSDSALLSLRGERSNSALRMQLLGANRHAAIAGANELPGKSNYFVSRDPKQWRTNVRTYAAVQYTGVYPGIDLVYHGNQRLLEYDFVVAPGADPRKIDLRFHGADKLTVNSDGALVMAVGENEVIEPAPVVYQEVDGVRRTVAGSYVLRGRGRVGFRVAEYDRERTLVIDPTLVYSMLLGIPWDSVSGIAVDAAGNAYVAGQTSALNFPTTPGALQSTRGSGFIMKLNTNGTTLFYSTYLGPGSDYAIDGIAIDALGDAYLTGIAGKNFPTTPGAFQTTFTDGPSTPMPGSAFVVKLNPTGSALVYSTYLGGSSLDAGFGITVDTSGSAYVIGYTYSSDFPVTAGAFQTVLPQHMQSTFVTKVNALGSALEYSTFLCGPSGSWGKAIAVDSSGSAYVTGDAASDFPVTPGAFQASPHGVYVTKLNPAGSGLVYSTFLGGSGLDSGYAIAVDPSGNAYVEGTTNSLDFPTTSGALQTAYAGGDYDDFVSKLNSTGTALVYSTYLGGSGTERALGIAVDAFGNAYLTGATTSSNFPITTGALQGTYAGGNYCGDAFVSKLNATGSALTYSTYLGGALDDCGEGVALDAAGDAYVTGQTWSLDFPTTPGAFQTSSGGMFVAKLNLRDYGAAPVTTAHLSGSLGSNGWYLGPVTVDLTVAAAANPVSATFYSVDNGAYRIYDAPFIMSSSAAHQLWYYSLDTSGRQEAPHGQVIAIDATKPVSRVVSLPTNATSPNFKVQWTGTDTASGIGSYDVYVSDNGGRFNLLWTFYSYTQQWFVGSMGHTYAFYSIAKDNAGNQEDPKTTAEAVTFVPQMPGDANGDGRIDCADIAIVKASFGKRSGQAGFDPRADINGDGVVDIRDLALVSQKLIPGTTCP